MTTNNLNSKPFLVPFLIDLARLLSIGFIAGAIVHSGGEFSPFHTTIGILGVTFFVVGNYLKQTIIDKVETAGLERIRFLLIALGLSFSIAMISGGVQHFPDNPKFSVYLIPIGVF
jgi:hypothetical protein